MENKLSKPISEQDQLYEVERQGRLAAIEEELYRLKKEIEARENEDSKDSQIWIDCLAKHHVRLFGEPLDMGDGETPDESIRCTVGNFVNSFERAISEPKEVVEDRIERVRPVEHFEILINGVKYIANSYDRLSYAQVARLGGCDPEHCPSIVVHPPSGKPHTFIPGRPAITPVPGMKIDVCYTGNA